MTRPQAAKRRHVRANCVVMSEKVDQRMFYPAPEVTPKKGPSKRHLRQCMKSRFYAFFLTWRFPENGEKTPARKTYYVVLKCNVTCRLGECLAARELECCLPARESNKLVQ